MGGFFGTISNGDCITDLFYGTDYNSHLGTRRGGMATYDKEEGFTRSIHNLENSYFRTKFEPGLPKFRGRYHQRYGCAANRYQLSLRKIRDRDGGEDQ